MSKVDCDGTDSTNDPPADRRLQGGDNDDEDTTQDDSTDSDQTADD